MLETQLPSKTQTEEVSKTVHTHAVTYYRFKQHQKTNGGRYACRRNVSWTGAAMPNNTEKVTANDTHVKEAFGNFLQMLEVSL